MTHPLLTISAFARAVDLAPSALRYYDEAGLLPPTEVDERTGYRYYTPDLERRAHMIRRMRAVGVPVETMRLVLDGTPDEAARLLQAFAPRSTETARLTSAAVADVVAGLRVDEDGVGPVAAPVDGPELATALRRVSSAADTDTSSSLSVVLLDIGDTGLTVVATNRYWLARWSMPLDGVHVDERRVVLPVGEAAGLAQWLSRQGTVTMSVGDGSARVVGTDEDREIRTCVDRFPAYRLVFDAQPPARGRVTVDRAALLAAAGTETSSVVIRVGADRVAVHPRDATEGVHLTATTTGAPVVLGFSADMLTSALTAMVGSDATLSYSDAERAVLLTSPDQRSFAALVMPSAIDS